MELRLIDDLRVDAAKMLKEATDQVRKSRRGCMNPPCVSDLETQVIAIEDALTDEMVDANYAIKQLKAALLSEKSRLQAEIKALQKKQDGVPVPQKPTKGAGQKS